MKLSSESLLSAPPADAENESKCSILKIERDLTGPPVKIAEEFQHVTFRKNPHDFNKEEKEQKKKMDSAGKSIFSKQYAQIYANRLFLMRTILQPKVKAEWQKDKATSVELKRIADLCESTGGHSPEELGQPVKIGKDGKRRTTYDHEQHIAMREDVVVAIIGTVFKIQPEKPSILLELVEENQMIPIKPKDKYISEKDTLILEDETTRVHLVPSETCGLRIDSIVNGVICAVKGKPTLTGKFQVEDVIWATPKPSVWPKNREGEAEMIFVSGLHLGSHRKNMSHLDLLFDYLQGLCGSPGELETSLKGRKRLFILGDSFGDVPPDPVDPNAKRLGFGVAAEALRAKKIEVAKKLDAVLDQLAQTMEVFIIPGQFDPAEPMFPQAPIHRCILPLSSRRTMFHSLSNPTRLEIPISSSSTTPTSLDFILSGGQNVIDAKKNTALRSSLDMANTLLKWGHICPTAPDTLSLHPDMDDSSFVLKTLPNIFIVGGQRHFKVRDYNNTLIVTVPSFADSGIAVVLNKGLNFVPLNIKLLN